MGSVGPEGVGLHAVYPKVLGNVGRKRKITKHQGEETVEFGLHPPPQCEFPTDSGNTCVCGE